MNARSALRRPLWLCAVAAVLAGGCARGCKREPAPAAAPQRLVIGIRDEPELLDNVLGISKSSVLVNNCIYSRFVAWDDSLHLVPDLLTEIPAVDNGGISPDHLTYRYHLRRGVRWHDGVPLSSADVEFTYRVIMDSLCGAETRQGFEDVDRCETPDSFTVVFHLRRPSASFVSDTFSDEDVLPKHLLESGMGKPFRALPFQRAPVGSGPFRFKEWVPASHLTVVRNPDYHGGAPALEEIEFRFVPDASALALQLQSRELDGVIGAEPGQIALLRQVPGMRVFMTPALSFEQLVFNCDDPILRDPALRRALAAATDRQALAMHAYDNTATAAYSDAHPRMPWHVAAHDSLNAFDAERAKGLLQLAGWVDSDGDGVRDRRGKPLRLEICSTAGKEARERVQAMLQQQWRAVGVDLRVRNYAPPVLFGSAAEGGILATARYQVALFGWQQPADPAAMEQVYGSGFAPPNGQNFGRFRNARADSLFGVVGAQWAAAEREATYREVEAVLARELPTIPLVWMMEIDAMPERLQGFRPNPTGSGHTWNVQAWRLGPPQ